MPHDTRACTALSPLNPVVSQVWSYGVTLVELYTKAETPYRGWTNAYVIERVNAGTCLLKPEHCPEQVYSNAIRHCFQKNPSQRKNFSDIVVELEDPFLHTRKSTIASDVSPDGFQSTSSDAIASPGGRVSGGAMTPPAVSPRPSLPGRSMIPDYIVTRGHVNDRDRWNQRLYTVDRQYSTVTCDAETSVVINPMIVQRLDDSVLHLGVECNASVVVNPMIVQRLDDSVLHLGVHEATGSLEKAKNKNIPDAAAAAPLRRLRSNGIDLVYEQPDLEGLDLSSLMDSSTDPDNDDDALVGVRSYTLPSSVDSVLVAVGDMGPPRSASTIGPNASMASAASPIRVVLPETPMVATLDSTVGARTAPKVESSLRLSDSADSVSISDGGFTGTYSALNMGPIGASQSPEPHPYVDFGGDGTVPSAVFDRSSIGSGHAHTMVAASRLPPSATGDNAKTSTV